MVKISVTTMPSNRTWLSFLLLRTRNSISAESWSYQKDGKRSSNKMEDIWLIKVHFLHRKKIKFYFTLEKRHYFLANPIEGAGRGIREKFSDNEMGRKMRFDSTISLQHIVSYSINSRKNCGRTRFGGYVCARNNPRNLKSECDGVEQKNRSVSYSEQY